MLELDYIAIIVSKEKHLEFYKRLGFLEKTRFQRSYDTVVFMESGSVSLEIFIDPKHGVRASDPENLGVRHIALTVDDFDKMIRKWECEPVGTDFFGKRFAFMKDPDGQPIEIKEK